MTVLDEIVVAADPALARHAERDGARERFADARLDPNRRFVLEAVYEGYLLHYASPRLFDGMDDDLRLLAGDALYALGLSRLAQAGDGSAVAALSDLISRSARAHAEGRGQAAEALWDASARDLES